MSSEIKEHTVSAVVPLLMVQDMERSLAFYVEALQFVMRNQWLPEGRLRWCWLELDGAALMLQEAAAMTAEQTASNGVAGNGVALYFQCRDALAIHREVARRGLRSLREPQVGNSAWEVFYSDPDGYKINFSSPTDLSEETLLSDVDPAAKQSDLP